MKKNELFEALFELCAVAACLLVECYEAKMKKTELFKALFELCAVAVCLLALFSMVTGIYSLAASLN